MSINLKKDFFNLPSKKQLVNIQHKHLLSVYNTFRNIKICVKIYKDVIDLKKLFILLLISFLVSACGKKQNITKEETTNLHDISKDTTKEEIKDNNPIKLGLYIDKKLTNEYISNWTRLQDICSMEVYFTNTNEISLTNQQTAWTTYYNTYQNIDNYKVGYHISFKAEGKVFNKTILSPNDIDDFFYYVQLYLYDDINQLNNTYYSHLTADDYNDNSIISSIKITGGSGINLVESDITITAFSYDDDDIDSNNNYIGNSKYTTIIKRG